MTHHILYKITNLVNGKIYVGVHSTDNLDDGYMGSGTALKRSQKKHGLASFSKTTIAQFETRQELLNAEREYVDESFVGRSDTYNCVVGGGSWNQTPSGFMDEDHRRKIGDATRVTSRGNTNRRNSITSEQALLNMQNCGAKGKAKPPRTDTHRANLAKAHVGLKATPEAKLAMSNAAKSRPRIACIHCGVMVPVQQINRWHNDNCKKKVNL